MKEVRKSVGTTTYYMPVWREEEIMANYECCHHENEILDREVVAKRYEKHGGVARSCFWNAMDFSDSKEQDRNLSSAIQSIEVEGIAKRLHELFCGTLTQPGTFRGLQALVHIDVADSYRESKDYTEGAIHLKPASKFVASEIAKKLFQYQKETLKLLAGMTGSVGGGMFEQYVHMIFQEDGNRKYKYRNLLTNKESKDKIPPKEEYLDLGELSKIVDFEEVPSSVDDGCYYKPKNVNFQAIDSFCSKGMFQMTIAGEHDIKPADSLKSVIAAINETNKTEKVKLYFVVPHDRYNSNKWEKVQTINKYKKNRDDVERTIEQYVLCINLV